ncbi:hypothetical protein GCM10011414_05020 [Croceivirga lutea]|uniref:hypothetical protein n=1 Tax=Croceivirga lutea TaxID=1775167 RepID=UPI0016399D73|nr:hypothetical protein [Croceivirga lutea]GGG38724.1 hypothetical protein GCM10011414_05020 [Croceivirga lutea]
MVKSEKAQHTEFLEKSISYLQSTGFENIKADLDGFESPKSFYQKNGDIELTPDIVATKNGRKFYFDISLKSSRSKLLKTKWVFLDTLSRMKSNKFKIITTKGHYKFTDNLLNELNLTSKTPIKI